MILRNLGIDCRTDRGWEFLEQEWKKEKDLFLSYFVIDLPKRNFLNE